MLKTRLRDFIITDDDWIFAVADYNHEKGIRSVLRYVPDPEGTRGRDKKFRKLDFDDAFNFMKHTRPEWVKDVHIVPYDRVKRVLYPNERIPALVRENQKVREIVATLEKHIPLDKMGVTGSLLPGLEIESSDIDFIVYGKSWFRARDIIALAKKSNSSITEITDEMWYQIYKKRIPDISFDEFHIHELRKGNRGMVDGTYFDLLYVRDWEDITTFKRGVDIGTKTIEATVTNADYSYDSPAIFKVDHPEISYVLSYTHTYAGQAQVGERIEARGMVETAGNIKRLVVGTKREPEGEWIRSLTLLEKS
ncbi:MAG: DNA polymerase subunit beta [Candidatus Methanoperedenaceae archaeon]|nr:DNA polymerase subunit beta [Candidatus Methanoperedenaceae archaeon]MDW7726643.1 DNA polymerase subunit beta [Candidatus Methanoperedens sp.]